MKPVLIFLLIAGTSGAAWGQEAGAPDEPAKVDGDGKADKPADELDIEGRVFVRSTLSRLTGEFSAGAPALHDLSLSSARLTADYRMGKRFKVVVEAELSENDLDLKDVFIRTRLRDDLDLTAGQFKKPISPIALESSWRLPMVERGLLGDLDSQTTAPLSSVPLPFGGRSIGAALELDLDAPAAPEIIVAVFEHSIIDDELIDVGEAVPLDPFVRARVEPIREVRLGATAALITHRNRSTTTASTGIDHAPLGSLDAEVEQGPVKVWLETFFGGSTVYGSDAVADDLMLGARTLVALRVDGLAPWLQRLEPFVAGSYVDPALDEDGDHGLQAATGVSLLFHERLRLQAEIELTRMSDDPTRLRQNSRDVFYTQLGAVF